MRSNKILDIGCGKKKYPGSIGIDANPQSNADIIANVEKGLPFPKNSFDLVYSNHTLEHIDPKKLIQVIEEIWRVTKPTGKIIINTPHFSGVGSSSSPVHLRVGFSSQIFNYFQNKYEYQKYGQIGFEIEKIRLNKVRTRNKVLNLFWVFIEYLANLNVLFCEIFWVYWFGGFDNICFELKPVKKSA